MSLGKGICHLMGGALMTVSCCFDAQKIAGLQGSTISDHHMIIGFGPFELLTCGLLQRGRTTPHLRLVLFEEPSSWLAFNYEYTVAKQNTINIQ